MPLRSPFPLVPLLLFLLAAPAAPAAPSPPAAPPAPAVIGLSSARTGPARGAGPALTVDPALTIDPPPARWTPPLGAPLVVAAPYRPPPHPYGAGHRGIDLPSLPGAVVRAPAAGTIAFAGEVVDRPVLTIRVDERTVVSLEPVATERVAGDPVAAGESVGVVASGGHCDEGCVHLGARVADAYVNPVRFFFHRPVLLPW